MLSNIYLDTSLRSQHPR